MELVVAELGMECSPDLVGIGLGCTNEGANIFGHRVVEPRDDALIDHCPFRIAAVGCGGSGGEVGGESKLADEDIEEALPFGVIGFREAEFNCDMVANVDGSTV
jgi:hypothetical protein